MSSKDRDSAPNDFEAEFTAACDELHYDILGLDGAECGIKIELWQKKYWNHPRIGHAARNHVSGMQVALSKHPGGPMVKVEGDNNQIQLGSNNTSQSGTNLASGDSNVIVPGRPGSQEPQPTQLPFSQAISIGNIVTGVAAGLLAVWWCLPVEWALGHARFLVTVFLCVAAFITTVLSWWQFSRTTWERRAYIALGSVLLLRSAAPSVVGGVAGLIGISKENADANINAYFGFGDDSIAAATTAIVQVVAGLVLIGFAFFSKRLPVVSN